jgi:DNA-binding MarR family transcriptional regulator
MPPKTAKPAKPGTPAKAAKSITPPVDERVFQFLNEIGIIAQLSANAFERVMPHGLTVAQFSLLNHCVRLGDGWTPARLASAFQVARATMTSTLQRLEAKGFIRLEDDAADRRSKHVYITAPGRAARAEALGLLGPELVALGRVASRADIDAALPVLEAVRTWLDGRR